MLELLGNFIIGIIQGSGYLGIFVLMTIESALIPLPSEITMPFAGSLIVTGKFALLPLAIVGSLGNLAGSLIAYWLGFKGEKKVRDLIKKYGKYVLVSLDDYNLAERWFRNYGEAVVFISRLTPVIRTFISLPAGVSKMNLKKFVVYTILGSFFWSLALALIGKILGQNWQLLGGLFHKFDALIILTFLTLSVLYIRHKLKKIKKESTEE